MLSVVWYWLVPHASRADPMGSLLKAYGERWWDFRLEAAVPFFGIFRELVNRGPVCRHSVVPSSAVLGLAGCFPTPMLSSHIPMPGRSSSIESKKRWIATVLLHR